MGKFTVNEKILNENFRKEKMGLEETVKCISI